MKGNEFFSDSVDLLRYKLHTIIFKNNDDKCFQYTVAVGLNHKQIKSYPESISSIKPFIDQYNWKEIKFPSFKKTWIKFELNNKSIALNILYAFYDTEEIRHAYKSKHKVKHENQAILLMLTGGEKSHYVAVK